MNQEQKSKNIYRKALVVFIVTVLFLTFFSKSFYNYCLPIVSVSTPKQGELDFEVKSSGEVIYSEVSDFYADKEGIVSKIFVGEGSRVKKGQRLMKIKLSDTGAERDITAKMEGIIIAVGVSEGMYISYMTNTVLYSLAKELHECSVVLQFSDKEITRIKKGDKAVINISGADIMLEGEVKKINPYSDEKFNGYHVDVRFKHEDMSVIGQKADVSIKNGSKMYDTLIPVSALRKDAKGYYVLVLQEDDSILGEGYRAERISVDLLDSDESYCAIEGIMEDAKVIVGATKEVAEGKHVYCDEQEGEHE